MTRIGWLLAALMLAACVSDAAPPRPSAWVSVTGRRALYAFDEAAGWDDFVMPGEAALFRVRAGALEGAVVGGRGFIWSQDNQRHRNIRITGVVEQTRGDQSAAMGLLCRADAAGNGYYFLYTSGGQFSIRKAVPQLGDPQPLVDWADSPAIRPGLAANTLTVDCIGDYLAFSINGVFVAEARDTTYSSGAVGAAVGAGQNTAWARFDDILVSEAAISGVR